MIRLQIKKRVFSIGDKYDITDDQDNPFYQVQGHLMSFGNKLDLLDLEGNEIAKIHQRVFSLVSEYDILQGDQVMAVVKQQMFTLIQQKFTVEGPGGSYEIEGDWLNWNYEIRAKGQVVAQVGHQFSMFQDRYGMEITEGADVPLLLCLAIVIDEISHPKE